MARKLHLMNKKNSNATFTEHAHEVDKQSGTSKSITMTPQKKLRHWVMVQSTHFTRHALGYTHTFVFDKIP